MSSSPTSSPATPLLASVLNELGREIISGELPEGHTFTLQSIGSRFDISRTVAREAMRALEQLGLVISSRRVGITVRPSSQWSVFDPTVIQWRLEDEAERPRQLRSLTELRIAVEPIAAHNAAINATEDQRLEFRELANTLRDLAEKNLGDSQEFLEADTRFHTLLLEASGNEMFTALSAPILKALDGRTAHGLQPSTPKPEAIDSHLAVAAAIATSNPAAAEEATRTILAEVREALKPVL